MSQQAEYIVLVNDGSYGGGITFNRKELDVLFKDWSEGKDLVDEDEEILTVQELIDRDGWVQLVNEEMCEMGDDYVSVRIQEVVRRKR